MQLAIADSAPWPSMANKVGLTKEMLSPRTAEGIMEGESPGYGGEDSAPYRRDPSFTQLGGHREVMTDTM